VRGIHQAKFTHILPVSIVIILLCVLGYTRLNHQLQETFTDQESVFELAGHIWQQQRGRSEFEGEHGCCILVLEQRSHIPHGERGWRE